MSVLFFAISLTALCDKAAWGVKISVFEETVAYATHMPVFECVFYLNKTNGIFVLICTTVLTQWSNEGQLEAKF